MIRLELRLVFYQYKLKWRRMESFAGIRAIQGQLFDLWDKYAHGDISINQVTFKSLDITCIPVKCGYLYTDYGLKMVGKWLKKMTILLLNILYASITNSGSNT